MCFSLIIVDEAAIAIEFDILVALQIPHDNLLFLGDHLQSRPVVISRGEYYDQLCISNFERILEHTSINRTMLKITYRFGKSIAEPVGMFGGYKGLASAHGEDSAFHNAFQNWWFSPANEVAYEPLLRKGVVRTKQEQEVQDLRRLCLSVGNGYSSLPRSGNTASSINYAHVKAGIAFLKALHSSEDLDLLSTDFVVVTPFESQAKLWREQLDIQWPNCGILVLTIGKSQGQEGKLVLFDTCLSCPTEGGYLGFLREWNRLNVAISRAEEVLICMLNVEVMREKLHSIYLQNPSWAYFLLDLIDRGDIIDLKVDHPTLLPLNAEEFRSGFWSNVQTAAVAKSIPLHHRRNGQGPSALLTTGKDSLSVQEEIYMKELEQLRKECRDNVRSTLSEEQAWQLQRAEEIKVRKGIAGLGAELPGGISSEDVEMGEEEVL
ncbi:AAA domain-containing protein [Halenospora varia]|nr:AAA domain-containing protein [Halenospora varia]